MKVNFTVPSIQAVFYILNNREPKGRAEIRSHSKLLDIIENNLTTTPENGQQVAKAGEIEIDDVIFDYFKDSVLKKIETGIPGVFAKGCNDLLDIIDNNGK